MSKQTTEREAARPARQELSDAALDAWILTRLASLGVDLSVLPEDDPDAPTDRVRILESAREFLRDVPGTIAAFEIDPPESPPALYPAEWSQWTGEPTP